MKKRLIVVAIEQKALKSYLTTLRKFFQGRIDIVGYYTNGIELPAQLEGDLVLYTSQELVPILRSHTSASVNILPLRRVLLRNNLEKLRNYPSGTSAVFFDYTVQTAKELVSMILDSGFRNINFTPLGRDSSPQEIHDYLGNSQLVVIAGLGDLVTIHTDRVLDLGWTPIDADVLIEIAILLDCFDGVFERQLFYYMRTTTNTNHGILYFLRTITESQSKYETVMELLEDGILVYGKNGVISHCNSALTAMFHLTKDNIINVKVRDVPLPSPIKENLLLYQPIEDKWIPKRTSGGNFTLAVYEIKIFSEVEDYVAVVSSAERVQRRSSQVRRHLKVHGFRAKYTFADILGASPAISQCRQTAERIAKAEGTVLITGETGTGKELFAQAIHNASPRREMPFVAVNCAALTSTLLESELFGYEAGAFTGSKAEGHIGLFECAHEGTLFLDEVGEIPIKLQAKLLRVLEEQEMRPVGSHRTVPIDVRIIAATNQNLHQLVEEKRFRADLYYRLSIFPLLLPPLRERQEDIPLLAQAFLDGTSGGSQTTPRLTAALMDCAWPGNIRELRNCIQYMTSLSSGTLDVDLLPPHMGPNAQPPVFDAPPGPSHPALAVTLPDQRIAEAILKELQLGAKSRAALTASLKARGYQVTEYHVRGLLECLRESGLAVYKAGRGGIRLTSAGYHAIDVGW